MKVVILDGAGWKFSRKSWSRFLAKWSATGAMPELAAYATLVCDVVPDITTWSIDDVRTAQLSCPQ